MSGFLALRGEIKITEFYKTQEKIMNEALKKLPIYESESLLYKIENLTQEQINKMYKKGEEITNNHFTSSSYNDFAIGKAMERRPHTILVRIEGNSGRLIEGLSTFNKEKEVLFKSKTKFYVDDIRMSTSPEDYITPIKTIILKEK
ncbi:ADP-ribosyltransferase [Chryseobacterium sp. FH2]|uniref:ADP-ribosyltransferase n=1 Tax=Chryseobacterium sp. FH2 TaxID=1674291 RepID=UPI00069F4A1E|nr:ADP-ribosyltransferase [Chryseobacterium sp. FH2]